MKTVFLTTAERFRRYQRDLRAYHQRSLFRRSHARFRRDLSVLPHLFLAPRLTQAAMLRESRERIQRELRGRAVWTLDTAARLVCGTGFLVTQDLTAYLDGEGLEWTVKRRLVEEPEAALLSLDPVVRRPSMLVVHLADEPPPFVALDSGDRVVTWDFLMRDIQGSLGWRPDLLTRIEDGYLQGLEGCRPRTALAADSKAWSRRAAAGA